MKSVPKVPFSTIPVYSMDGWMRDILSPNVDGVPNSTSNFPDELLPQPPVLTATIEAPLLTNDGYFGDGDYSRADQFFPNFEYPASVDDDLIVLPNSFPLTNAGPVSHAFGS
ncbi:hypothetical protein FRC11_011310 [Ceratobasidium sp. 423]|nr:hypothetical protein FRC11_011310 [Ceratobasidium sp. 423]